MTMQWHDLIAWITGSTARKRRLILNTLDGLIGVEVPSMVQGYLIGVAMGNTELTSLVAYEVELHNLAVHLEAGDMLTPDEARRVKSLLRELKERKTQ